MADVKITQLYDANKQPLYPSIITKTINGVSLSYEPGGNNEINITSSNVSIKVKLVYIYKAFKDQPSTPKGGSLKDNGNIDYPTAGVSTEEGEWTDEITAKSQIAIDSEKKLWRSYATLNIGGSEEDSDWSTPAEVNDTIAGLDGKDGSDIKFIYCLTKNSSTPDKPNTTGDTFNNSSISGEWSDSPMGVDEIHKYEWVSISVKPSGNNEKFGGFSDPVIWSKWGEDGRDGDGVEYVFLLTNSADAPKLDSYDVDSDDYQSPEYKPSTNGVEWSDDYTAPSYNNRYSWVAIRHLKDGVWREFSEPKLWNIYKVAGKSYADLYRRSTTQLSANDLPIHERSIYYIFNTDKYYSDSECKDEIKIVGDWYGDIPSEGGRYLYKTQAYVDIIDVDRPVEITKDRWSGPYFISLDGVDGENAIAESAYISMNNDSFSLPITDSYNTFKGIEYKDSLDVKLMYGDDELDIDKEKIVYNSNVFEYVNSEKSSDKKTLTIEFKIKNDVSFANVEDIVIELTGEYNNKEYTAKKSFRIIPYVSSIDAFYKIRINDDTVYVEPNGCANENGEGIWEHTITVDLVDSKGNYIDASNIGCKFVYENKNNATVDISTGEIKIKNCLNADAGYKDYVDVINLPNPLAIKLVDIETNVVREIEYVDFINKPQDGVDGSAGVSNRMVFAYRSTKDYKAPEIPTGGSVDFDTNEVLYPKDWGPSQDLGGVVWLSTCEFFSDGTSDLSWSNPMRITGDQGLPGEDGTKIEFAYHLCESENVFSNLNSPSGDIIYFPENGKDASQWTDNPQGIDTTYIIEACSQRTFDEKNGVWSEWSKPFIWSKWGEDGTDGDGVEYIFRIVAEKQENFYPLSDDAYESDNEYVKNILQQNDFVPNREYVDRYVETNGISNDNASILHTLFDKKWTDEPSDVGVSEPYEYVSIRRKKNGIWGSFSKATLWNEWHRDGYNTYTEFAFAAIPSNDTLVGCYVIGGTYEEPLEDLKTYTNDNVIKTVNWSDTLPAYDENNSIWMISAFFSEDEKYENNGIWTSPTKMTDSQTLQVEYCDSSISPANGITEMSNLVTTYPTLTLEELENKFRELEASRGFIWGDENIVNPNWMATSRRVNGNWSNWVVTKIKGEKGDPGAKGDPGTSVQIKGSFNNREELEEAYNYYLKIIDVKPTPYFTDDNLSGGDGYLINGELWIYDGSKNPVFTSAWTNVGQIKGDKGDSVYLYIAYSNDGGKNFTNKLSDKDRLGSTPGKYIGICISNIEKSVDFPTIDNIKDFTWSKWKGDDGFGVEQIFILNDSSNMLLPEPTIDDKPEKWNEQDFKPTGWSDIPQTPTISNPYCLMAVRNYPPKDDLVENKYNLFRGDGSNAIVFSYLAKDGTSGTSPFHIELSNEYDQVYVTDNVVMTAQDISTYVTIYKGSENVSKEVTITCSDGSATYDGSVKSYKLIRSFNEGEKVEDNEVNIKIDVSKNSSIGLDFPTSHTFKIIKLNGTIDYDLKVTPTYIKVDNNGKCSSDDIKVSLLKSSIGTNNREVEEIKNTPEGYSVKYSVDGSTTFVNLDNLKNSIIVDSSNSYYTINLYNKDGSMVDTVNVELLKDGKDGVDGNSPYHIELSNDFDLIYTVDGKVNGEQTFNTKAQLLLGNLPVIFNDVSVNNIDNSSIGVSLSYKKYDEGTNKDEYIECDITLTIPDGYDMLTNINGTIVIKYESEYDEDDKTETISTYFTLKPTNDESLYQIQATPSYITRSKDTSVYVKLYKKGKNGLELVSNTNDIPNDVSIRYVLDNDVENEYPIKNGNLIVNNNQIFVYKWEPNESNASTNEIDIRLYKGANLHDNVNIEIKEEIKPSAVFEVTPDDIIMYFDGSGNILNNTHTIKYSFIYEGVDTSISDFSIKSATAGAPLVEIDKITNNKKFKIVTNITNFEEYSEGTYSYTITAKHNNIEYYKNIYITFTKSELVISSLNDTFTVSELYEKITNSEYYSALFSFYAYFNGKSIDKDLDAISIDIEKMKEKYGESEIVNYLEINDNFTANIRNGSWYLNFNCHSDGTYDIIDFIKNTNEKGKEPKIYFKFEYKGISVTKDWLFVLTSDTDGRYYSIKCDRIDINESNNENPIEIYFEKNTLEYTTLPELYNEGKVFAYSIDGNAEIVFDDENKIKSIPKSRGNYAFYPNGYVNGEYAQEPIIKEIRFMLYKIMDDGNKQMIQMQNVERVDILRQTEEEIIISNALEEKSLEEIFDENYNEDYSYIIV